MDGLRLIARSLRNHSERHTQKNSDSDSEHRTNHRQASFWVVYGVALVAAAGFSATKLHGSGVVSQIAAVAGMTVWVAGFLSASVEDSRDLHFDHRYLWLTAGTGCALVALGGGSLAHGALGGAVCATFFAATGVLETCFVNRQPRSVLKDLRWNGDVDLAFLAAFPVASAMVGGLDTVVAASAVAIVAVSAKIVVLVAKLDLSKIMPPNRCALAGYFAFGGATVMVAFSI